MVASRAAKMAEQMVDLMAGSLAWLTVAKSAGMTVEQLADMRVD